MKTQNKGITLIALVITIIVLLILAGVAINMAIDSDGLFGKANEAAHKWNTAVGEEEEGINDLLNKLDEMTPKSMITKWNIVANDEIGIYLYYPEDYNGNALTNNTNVTIDWGDGTVETINSSNLQYDEGGGGYVTHTYTTANTQTTVIITGNCNTIDMACNSKLTSIEKWGYTNSLNYYFGECENLESVAIPEENTFNNVTEFYYTFEYCTSLTSIPEGLFANCDNVTSFQGTFYGCTSLTTIGAHAFDGCSSVESFDNTFNGCTNITTIGDYAFANCSSVTSFEIMFKGNTSLESIGDYAFANCTSARSFNGTFFNCTNLQSIPEHLFENTPNVSDFVQTFYNCTSLTGNAIPLWERATDDAPVVPDGNGCYEGCTGLTDYNDIPEGWKVGISPM